MRTRTPSSVFRETAEYVALRMVQEAVSLRGVIYFAGPFKPQEYCCRELLKDKNKEDQVMSSEQLHVDHKCCSTVKAYNICCIFYLSSIK